MSSESLLRLRQVPLFSELDQAGLERVDAIANEFEVESGHVLMERGQPGLGMFVIESGRVRVDVPGGDPVTLGAGDFVGELSVFADHPRTARVVAEERVGGVAIRRQDLISLLMEEPSLAVAMLSSLAGRYGTH
jgi:CRP/FNR family transcriptional regulator, cyclic AMP receptor protein